MLSIYNDICTLYHRNGDGYDRVALDPVCWQGKIAAQQDGHGVVSADYVTVLLPSEHDHINISKGDFMVKGLCDLEISSGTTKELHSRYGEVITVKSIANHYLRRGSRVNHREVCGE